MIVIVDYGMGNVRSLSNAFDFLGYDAEISRDPADFASADRIVLPGVGAFGDAIDLIRSLGLEAPLNEQVLQNRKPVLGICLGMQLMAATSHEHGHHSGLGWFDADVVPMVSTPDAKVPQVGWNRLDPVGDGWLFRGLPAKGNDVYFVHSFHMKCRNAADVIATTHHAQTVTAAVARDHIVATQFHPEKSQDNGLQILQNWMERDF
ncbi:imidazole glycerol phosphate synthase subunit HisH [Meridianimarinicoccus roseus]|uniref:Imidazole glycerol phosphate synthase subunit HisH n=1 Tax=Meridianimarinicoccus roseus TaxID=2072018 RepID=A0A2V2LHZ0_9RHOB|nr:imidazole glycerol phosphate synthase subunit HisH [Meridianimarinicoccus roseus]PWR04542.1 imidazole glycerol phosphate synthase subunit HisH [Meridianimarinicoccus roseus]